MTDSDQSYHLDLLCIAIVGFRAKTMITRNRGLIIGIENTGIGMRRCKETGTQYLHNYGKISSGGLIAQKTSSDASKELPMTTSIRGFGFMGIARAAATQFLGIAYKIYG